MSPLLPPMPFCEMASTSPKGRIIVQLPFKVSLGLGGRNVRRGLQRGRRTHRQSNRRGIWSQAQHGEQVDQGQTYSRPKRIQRTGHGILQGSARRLRYIFKKQVETRKTPNFRWLTLYPIYGIIQSSSKLDGRSEGPNPHNRPDHARACNGGSRMATSTLTLKRTIRNPQAFVGKRVDPTKWEVPQGYVLCAFTGKLVVEDDSLYSFAHHYFDREWLIEKGIYVEDAEYLSEEGYDAIMSVLEREGLLNAYTERPCDPNRCEPLNRVAKPDSLLLWYAEQFIAATLPDERTRIALTVRNDGYSGVEFRSAIAAAESAVLS